MAYEKTNWTITTPISTDNLNKIEEGIAEASKRDGVPVGCGYDYFGTTAPNGYMFADGSAISRTEYAELFAIIGTTYGTGDGSTTFNLPDKRSRTSVMVNSEDADFNTLGKKVGSSKNTLVAANLPALTGSLTLHAGDSGTNIYQVSGVFSTSTKKDGSYKPGGDPVQGAYSYSKINFNNGGKSQQVNNIQQSLVCNYIIKVK